MFAWIRSRRLSHASVVAYLALFVALGGTAVAAKLVTGADVQNESLTGAGAAGVVASLVAVAAVVLSGCAIGFRGPAQSVATVLWPRLVRGEGLR